MVDAPLHRETLATQLAQRMIAFITVNGLKSGAALPSEARLASQFGVSRPIMRVALRLPQARGIIEVTNGTGATVRPLTSDPLSSFFAWATHFDEHALVELLEVRCHLMRDTGHVRRMLSRVGMGLRPTAHRCSGRARG